jgi:pimeloyl-ACP methyl ester carboxylesterase
MKAFHAAFLALLPLSALPQRLLFLPGASGDTGFWRPVARLLTGAQEQVYPGWPGFGPTPADPAIESIEDLVGQVVALIDRPAALIAQSAGGAVALLVALERPAFVTHLVLTALSAGVDAVALGGRQWRPPKSEMTFELHFLFAAYDKDLASRLPQVRARTLLLWGDADPISPLAVGRLVASLVPASRLHVVKGGDPAFANSQAAQVAPLVNAHLRFAG